MHRAQPAQPTTGLHLSPRAATVLSNRMAEDSDLARDGSRAGLGVLTAWRMQGAHGKLPQRALGGPTGDPKPQAVNLFPGPALNAECDSHAM
ncbi:MAG: hypothetical protein RMK20_09885 [Verrucomicrobiales bacterium]|nr:hypothetical protein [Verrucomicrobiales bacterium]